jgi:hypothetical protein
MIDPATWRWGTGQPRSESWPFTSQELARLRFLRWLVETGRLAP